MLEVFVDQSVSQQLAALVAVVSVAIIGVAIMLVPAAWRGFENTSFALSKPERRVINRILLAQFGSLLILFFITNVVGIYAPSYALPIGRTIFLLLGFIVIFYSIIVIVVNKARKSRPTPIEPLPYLYRSTLLSVVFCVLFSSLALFGVAQTMLNIEIGPYNQDNFLWAKWSLLNGIAFFLIGIVNFGYTYIIQSARPREDTTGKKRVLIFNAVSLVLISFLLVIVSINVVKQYDSFRSFYNDFLSMPLDVKGSVTIEGGQFKVKNDNDYDWQNITLHINQGELSTGYFLNVDSLRQGETFTSDIREFANNDGVRFNLQTTKPLRFSIKLFNSSGRSGEYSGNLKPVKN
jgi:hypothetical protein